MPWAIVDVAVIISVEVAMLLPDRRVAMSYIPTEHLSVPRRWIWSYIFQLGRRGTHHHTSSETLLHFWIHLDLVFAHRAVDEAAGRPQVAGICSCGSIRDEIVEERKAFIASPARSQVARNLH